MIAIPSDAVDPAAGRLIGPDTLPPELAPVAERMRLLSEPTRVKLLCALADGERNVKQLCDAIGLPQPTASHQLSHLRIAGLLSRRRAGKMVYYSLGPSARPVGGGLEIDAGRFRVIVRCG